MGGILLTRRLLLQTAAARAAAIPIGTRIAQRIRGFHGTVSLYAKNLSNGKEYGLRPDERVRTASTIKLPILAALFEAVEQGRFAWDDEIVLREEDKMPPSGVLQEFSAGTRVKLRDLMHLMIVISDNTATNLIVDRLPGDDVNAFLDRAGFPQTRFLRKIGGKSPSKANEIPGNQPFGIGVSTPREMAGLMEKIALGELVSADASREMLATLRRQQYKDGIGRHLPDPQVASKSGSLDALRSDVGLIETKKARIAMAITIDKMPVTDYSPDNLGSKLISDLTQIVVTRLSL